MNWACHFACLVPRRLSFFSFSRSSPVTRARFRLIAVETRSACGGGSHLAQSFKCVKNYKTSNHNTRRLFHKTQNSSAQLKHDKRTWSTTSINSLFIWSQGAATTHTGFAFKILRWSSFGPILTGVIINIPPVEIKKRPQRYFLVRLSIIKRIMFFYCILFPGSLLLEAAMENGDPTLISNKKNDNLNGSQNYLVGVKKLNWTRVESVPKSIFIIFA